MSGVEPGSPEGETEQNASHSPSGDQTGGTGGEGAQSNKGEAEQPRDEDRADARELSLNDQLEAARAERDAHYDQLLRARAELENFRKRIQRENQEARLYQALPLIRELLPALDNLERAIQAARDAGEAEELVQGVEMVKKQIEDTLARYSAVPIEAAGRPFDPNLHEAVQHVPSQEHPPMTVVEEVERGFKMHERVVRPSKVVVSSGPPE